MGSKVNKDSRITKENNYQQANLNLPKQTLLNTMEIDKHLYNIQNQDDQGQRLKYIDSLKQEHLTTVQNEVVSRVVNFDPDDEQTIDQIRAGFKLYIQLMSNQKFSTLPIDDSSFICSLAFYLNAQKTSQCLEKAVVFVQHQYLNLGQKAYAESINLFKALLDVYESITQAFYEKITLLMLKMVVQNIQLLAVINHKYYFLQCLIQIINQQNDDNKLCEYFAQLRKLYSSKKALLFHSIDFQILIDILLRTLVNENQTQIIEQTLKLYLILSENPIIAKDGYRKEEFHEGIKEKLNCMDENALDKNLKNIIHELLNFN